MRYDDSKAVRDRLNSVATHPGATPASKTLTLARLLGAVPKRRRDHQAALLVDTWHRFLGFSSLENWRAYNAALVEAVFFHGLHADDALMRLLNATREDDGTSR